MCDHAGSTLRWGVSHRAFFTCLLPRLLCLSLCLLHLLRRDTGCKDGDGGDLCVRLGESLDDEHILWIGDGILDFGPLLGGDVDGVCGGGRRRCWQSFGQGWRLGLLHDGDDTGATVNNLAWTAYEGDLHGTDLSFLGCCFIDGRDAVIPGERDGWLGAWLLGFGHGFLLRVGLRSLPLPLWLPRGWLPQSLARLGLAKRLGQMKEDAANGTTA